MKWYYDPQNLKEILSQDTRQNVWLCLLQALGKRVIYQGGCCIILLVNVLHMHFYSSACQYPLYFMADSSGNCPLCYYFCQGIGASFLGKCILASTWLGCPVQCWQVRHHLCQTLWEMVEHRIRWQCITWGREGSSQPISFWHLWLHIWISEILSTCHCTCVQLFSLPLPDSLPWGAGQCCLRCYKAVWWCKKISYRD